MFYGKDMTVIVGNDTTYINSAFYYLNYTSIIGYASLATRGGSAAQAKPRRLYCFS